MFDKLKPDKIAKGAEKLGGNAGELAKGVLQGVEKLGKLDQLGNVQEQAVAALRKLIESAKKQLDQLPEGKNKALDACIQKAKALLDSDHVSTEAVAKLSAELGALMQTVTGNAQDKKASTAAPATAKIQTTQTQVPAQTSGAVQFSDVDQDAYYYDAVQWAVKQGIASGTTETTFSPDKNATRGQTITFLWRASGSPAPKDQTNPFTDVDQNAYYYNAVLWAAERGIISGTTFHPDDAVTRGQLAAFLYRNAGSPAVQSSGEFTDVPSDAYYSQAVAWAAAKGITSGTGEHTFSPDKVCTRGQIVTFLYRAKK